MSEISTPMNETKNSTELWTKTEWPTSFTANKYFRNIFQVGDVVWHLEKGYLARVTKVVDNDVGDLFLNILTPAPKGSFWSSGTNSSKVKLDYLGKLIYG